MEGDPFSQSVLADPSETGRLSLSNAFLAHGSIDRSYPHTPQRDELEGCKHWPRHARRRAEGADKSNRSELKWQTGNGRPKRHTLEPAPIANTWTLNQTETANTVCQWSTSPECRHQRVAASSSTYGQEWRHFQQRGPAAPGLTLRLLAGSRATGRRRTRSSPSCLGGTGSHCPRGVGRIGVG